MTTRTTASEGTSRDSRYSKAHSRSNRGSVFYGSTESIVDNNNGKSLLYLPHFFKISHGITSTYI